MHADVELYSYIPNGQCDSDIDLHSLHELISEPEANNNEVANM